MSLDIAKERKTQRWFIPQLQRNAVEIFTIQLTVIIYPSGKYLSHREVAENHQLKGFLT